MENYYEALGLKYDCTIQQIKQSFRHKAKLLHPDTKEENEKSDRQMAQLLHMYHTLVDPARRRRYDRMHKIRSGSRGFDYREFLKRRTHDLESQSKLIFYELMHKNRDAAIAIYDTHFRYGKADMLHADRGDYMDCTFLLGEAYLAKHEWLEAYRLFYRLARLEKEQDYFRHFFVEIVNRIQHLVCSCMIGKVSNSMILYCLHEVIEYDFGDELTALCCLKAAELNIIEYNFDEANTLLEKGIALSGNRRTMIPVLKRLQKVVAAL